MKYLTLLIIVVYGQGAYWLGNYIGNRQSYEKGYTQGQLDTLPSQSKIQEILSVPVDGVVGPETRKAWDAVIEKRVCDEFAAPIMEQFEKDFDKKYGIDEN